MSEELPRLVSAAFDDIPRPDYADVAVHPLPPGADPDPAAWARAVFGRDAIPWWGKALFAVRYLVAPLVRADRGDATAFRVRSVRGDEALMAMDDRHLDWRCALGVDTRAGLIRMTSTVRFHGWRGRLYFLPVRVVHPLLVRAMLRRATRRAAGK